MQAGFPGLGIVPAACSTLTCTRELDDRERDALDEMCHTDSFCSTEGTPVGHKEGSNQIFSADTLQRIMRRPGGFRDKALRRRSWPQRLPLTGLHCFATNCRLSIASCCEHRRRWLPLWTDHWCGIPSTSVSPQRCCLESVQGS